MTTAPGTSATTGDGPQPGRHRRGRRGGRGGERFMVPKAEFQSYYGRPIIKEPVWEVPDVPGYLFFGGLAGASSVLAAGAQLTGRPGLARVAKLAGLGGISISTVFLIHDLGRPARFHHMLRVFKLSSPMSVGSWILSVYGPLAGAAALADLAKLLPAGPSAPATTRVAAGAARLAGPPATAAAALLGPAVATYTAVLICDTSVPAWHSAHQEMPYVFAGSAASAAGGLGLLAVPRDQQEPARRMAIAGSVAELAARQVLERRLGDVAEPYHQGKAGRLLKAAEILTAAGAAGAALTRRSRIGSALSGVALLAASALTRYGIFEAGLASARDPKYTVVPQRRRQQERKEQEQTPATG
ncbi:MAG TPA: NrfD/PsrC family molybdoenzyme membrane anchor subunit [Streptosporangiaceae bacterium]|jgi:formate-dependent nitrite reductase membrane component NrfD